MKVIFSVDPGVKGHGWACWKDGVLVDCGWGFPPLIGYDAPHIVIEVPQVYQGRAQKGDPNDLIDLAFEAGKLVDGFEYTKIRPRAWKGTVPKPVMLQRILAKLSDAELALLRSVGVKKSVEKDVLDGIGIGLHYFKRL